MLSDAEQRRLAEIESLLRAADPVFVRRFEDRWRARRRWRLLAMLAVPVAVLMTFIGLALGSVVAAVIGLSATVAAFGVWFSHRATSGWPAKRDERS
jgi:L-lactate permease